MTALVPIHLYGLEVPAGDIAMSARPEVPAAFRITMAAIDPTAEPEGEEGAPARATLRIIRQPLDLDDYDSDEDDEDDFDADEMERILAENDDDEDEDDESDDADLNGGPSDPAKSKKARQAAAEAQIRQHLLAEHGVDVDADGKVNGVNGTKKSPKAKGKMPLSDEDDDEMEDEDSDEDDSEGEVEEFVICTLDPTKNYQQPLDITIGEDERVWFKVSGTHSIYLTGNYVEMPEGQSRLYDPEDDEDDEYDLEPDEDELDGEEDEEEDELDGMDDPRITELDDEMEEDVPKLVTKAAEKPKSTTVKGSNKRSAPESDDAEAGGETLDDMIMANSTAVAATNSEPKLSKKQLKKLKKNDGSAAAATVDKAAKPVVEDPSSTKSDKKVSFAKNLEQGPTPTKDATTKDATANAEKPEKAKATLGVRTVQGVTIDDKKLGTGAAAKKGDRVGMRYIGKLNDGKVFDSNKKGKPFSFKLGSGEVIKGWDIGVAGMAIGGERRITVPAHLAYGSKGTGPIPANSTLVFDVKMLEINKSK